MVTLNVYSSHYGIEHRWDPDLIEAIWRDADQNSWPMHSDHNYYCGAGVSLAAIGSAISLMVDLVGAEVVLMGRAPCIDQVLNEFAANGVQDVEWRENRLEQVCWWRGCLVVRLLRWQIQNYSDFPLNELWLLPLGPAREGLAPTMARYVDTSLPAI